MPAGNPVTSKIDPGPRWESSELFWLELRDESLIDFCISFESRNMFLRAGGWGGKDFCELPLDDLLPLVEAFLMCNALLWACSGDVLEICSDDDSADSFIPSIGNISEFVGMIVGTLANCTPHGEVTMTNGVLNATCWDFIFNLFLINPESPPFVALCTSGVAGRQAPAKNSSTDTRYSRNYSKLVICTEHGLIKLYWIPVGFSGKDFN